MPMSEACMEGIRVNGLRWKRTIRLGNWPALLGKLNEQGDALADDAEVERCAAKIVAIVRAFVSRHDWAKGTDLSRRADDLELVADCGLAEVNFAMAELYDSFDYWRILVKAPRVALAPGTSASGQDAQRLEGEAPQARSSEAGGVQ